MSDKDNGHALVNRMAQKPSGSAFHRNAPLMVDDAQMVTAMSATPGVRDAIAVERQCAVALLGISGTEPATCSCCPTGNLAVA